VVFLHWGQEYRSAPTPAQRTLARKLPADPAVDLIIGHHAHVVQPVQRIHGKWVAFGLGNSLSAQSAACCPAATQDGVLLQVTVVRKAGRFVVGAVRYTPYRAAEWPHKEVELAAHDLLQQLDKRSG
jgi:poly-gamma-glutamate capsule biosynthesis protein CapA/YwtB (metallophosphatase superfamily)